MESVKSVSKNKGKLSALLSGLIALVVVLAGLPYWNIHAREYWHVRKLRNGNVHDRRLSVVCLAKMRGRLSLPHLRRAIGSDGDRVVRQLAVLSLLELAADAER